MLDAGVPLLRSLNTVSAGLQPRLQKAFTELAAAAAKGNPLAETMAKPPRIFEALDVMLIQAAEVSGSLPESLALLSKWHEFSNHINRLILSGCLLPVIIIHIAAVIAPLPSFLIGGLRIQNYVFDCLKILSFFYVPATIVYAILRMSPKTGPFRRVLDRLALKIPILGQAIYRSSISRYCRAFYMLFKAGLPITDCTARATLVTGNAVVADLFQGGAASAREGRDVSEGFSTKLPTEFLDMWRIGEETGSLEEVARRLADSNGNGAEFLFTEFARWLPRFVYVLVAGVMIYYILRNSSMITSLR